MKYNEEQINELLVDNSDWKYDGKLLVREFTFADFSENIQFVNKVAIFAESMNHHPDILIYGWNKLRIMVYSHDEDGITERDIALVKKIDSIL